MREDIQYISEILDELDAVVHEASSVPMRRGRAVLDRSDFLSILDELRGTLPSELSESESLLREKQTIVAAAEEEGKRIVQEAHRVAEERVKETEPYRLAQRRAAENIDRAERYAQEVASGSEVYCDRVMGQLESWFQDSLISVGESREELSGMSGSVRGEAPVESSGKDSERDDDDERGWRVSSA